MTGKTKLLVDTVERAIATWLEVFFGLLIVANVWSETQAGGAVAYLSAAQTAAVAAIPGALAVLKAGVSSFLGDRDSAAALPKELD